MRRRDFLALSVRSAAGLALCGGAVAWSSAGVVRLHRQTIHLPNLPPAFEGLKIALLSDLHHGEWISREHIRSAIRLANAQTPDVVALTGDYIHRGTKWVKSCFREISGLRAPLGVFGVLGNHDHYGGAARVCRSALAAAGACDVTNSGIDLIRDGQTLRIGGVGDLWEEKQNLSAALGPRRKPGTAVILSHNPDYAEQISDPRVALVLSGHTHGGQICFPIIGAPIVPSRYHQKYRAGLCRAPHVPIFVTTGVGSSFPPVRWNCPPEVALLTLSARGRGQSVGTSQQETYGRQKYRIEVALTSK